MNSPKSTGGEMPKKETNGLPAGEVFLLSYFCDKFSITKPTVMTKLSKINMEPKLPVSGNDDLSPHYLDRDQAQIFFDYLTKEQEVKNFRVEEEHKK